MRVFALVATILLVASSISPITLASRVQSAEGALPWGSDEPYPWLSYLKQLAVERGAPLQNVRLLIITRHEATIMVKAKEAFLRSPIARELGIVDIVPVYAGPELWEKYISDALDAARRGRGQPIDVAWGGGPTLFNYLDEKGYLFPLDESSHPEFKSISHEASKIPERIAGAPTRHVGSDGSVRWIGAAISSFGFTINYERLSQYGLPKPVNWFDLARPEYAKYLPGTQLTGLADPTMSTSHTRVFEIILQTYGWELGWRVLTLMAANAKVFSGSSDVRDAVIRGDIAVGITIDFYGYTAMQQNPSCEYVVPAGQTIVNADPIAVLRGTKYPIHAAAFVAWVLSEHGGQQVWLDPNINRLPVNSRVFDTEAGRARQDVKRAYEATLNTTGITFNETLALMIERAMQYYFKSTLVDVHHDLQAVWASIAQAYLNGEIDRRAYNYLVWKLTDFFEFEDPVSGERATFTQEYAAKISRDITQAHIYQAIINEWKSGALRKYNAVYGELEEILNGKQIAEEYPDLERELSRALPPLAETATPTETRSSPAETPSAEISAKQPSVPIEALAVVAILAVSAIAIIMYYARKLKK